MSQFNFGFTAPAAAPQAGAPSAFSWPSQPQAQAQAQPQAQTAWGLPQQPQAQAASQPFSFGGAPAAQQPAAANAFTFGATAAAPTPSVFAFAPAGGAATPSPWNPGGAATTPAVAAPAPSPTLEPQDEEVTRFLEAFPRHPNGQYCETSSARRPLTHLGSLLDTYRKAGDRASEKLHSYALRHLLVQFREEGAKANSKLITDGEWEDAQDWKETLAVSPALALPPPFTPTTPITVPLAPMPVEGFEGLRRRMLDCNAPAQNEQHRKLLDLQLRLLGVHNKASERRRRDPAQGAPPTMLSFDERTQLVRRRQRALTRRMLAVCQRMDMAFAKRLRLHESGEEVELREELQALFASLSHQENLEMRLQDVRVQLDEQLHMAAALRDRQARGGGGGGGGGGALGGGALAQGGEALPSEVLASVDELQASTVQRLKDLQAYQRDIQAAQGAVSRLRSCCGPRAAMAGWSLGY